MKRKTGFLAKEAGNRGRQPEIDCLKAFCIVPMIILHTFETCAEDPGGFYHVVHLLEALTGAAAFMLCMGIGTRYSRHQTPRDFARRGIGLLTATQLMYLLRDAAANLTAYWCTGNKIFAGRAMLVFEVDIMTFAGLAFLLLALLRKLRAPGWAVFLTGVGMNIAGYVISKLFRTTEIYLLDQLLGCLVVTEAESYFPLCCYFVFVAAGYWLGEIYQRIRDKDGLSTRVLAVCAPLAGGYYILRACVTIPWLPAFFTTEQYILNPLTDAAANCLMALALLALFHKLLKRRGGEAPGFVNHLSKHINQYYRYSYVMLSPVGTLLYALRGGRMPGVWIPLLYALIVITATYFLIEWRNRHMHFEIESLQGRRRTIVYAAIWALTVLIVAYVYPRTDVYANVWNNYLV